MTEVSKKKQAEQEGAARKSKAAGRVIMDRKDAGLMKAGGSGNARKAANELARAGVKVGGGRKTAAKRNKPRRSEKDGAEMLRQESDQALVEISQHVVSKLKAGAKEGDVVCVKACTMSRNGWIRSRGDRGHPALVAGSRCSGLLDNAGCLMMATPATEFCRWGFF